MFWHFYHIRPWILCANVKGLLGALVFFLNKIRFLLKCILHCCLINISLLATHITYVHTRFCLIHIKLYIYTKRIQFTFIHILFLCLGHCWAVCNYTICIFFVCNEIKAFFFFGPSYIALYITGNTWMLFVFSI